MVIFGSIRQMNIRPWVQLTPIDYGLMEQLAERPKTAQQLATNGNLREVQKSIERLQLAAKIKPLAGGAWTAQKPGEINGLETIKADACKVRRKQRATA